MTKIKSQRGFTLIEMAVVLVLFGIIASMGMKIAGVTMENIAVSDTKSKAETIKIALIGYLRTNGRLPCPDIASVPTGTAPATCTTAALGYGVVPWLTLGLSKDAALDGWHNFFTYRVANNGAASPAPATPAVLRANNAYQDWTVKSSSGFNILSINSPNSGGYTALQINSRNLADTVTAITYNAVVVIYSHGKNGLGATTSKGTTNTASTGADELVNGTAGATVFIVRDSADSVAGGAYDDVVSYMTSQDLLQPLVTDGTLKATCNAYCTTTDPVISCTNPSYSPSCGGGGNNPYCAARGVACSNDTTTPTCSHGTPICTQYSFVTCSAAGIPVGNPSLTCP